MKKLVLTAFLFTSAFFLFAHFQMIYTSSSIIEQNAKSAGFILTFTHPFESGLTMDIGKNEQGEIKGLKEFYSIHKGKKLDLLSMIKESEFTSAENKASAYTFTLDKDSGFRGGGDWVLVAVPHPYYEASEEGYIQQITKVFINKAGLATDWQTACVKGYPEILPLVKPYDIWKGSIFRAVVLDSNGKPVPFAEIEFAHINYDIDMQAKAFTGKAKLEQAGGGIILADATGVFEFIPPCAGYWGFSALGVGKEKEFSGKALSQDAVIWIEINKDETEPAPASNENEEKTAASEETSASEKDREPRKDDFSPAALIIVILLFAVMFAWPPIFKKMSEKSEKKDS
ncbi:DUF4198 domain-containing protein [Treponema phagedenis]|uniref:DUF4198 domain-containing protein n=1 Tax=Treponema phagedenis TaxID=162 RepID=UPI0011E77DD8|nr:DUF4198 domain-containing protein [Treponema phagedenis]QEJ95502.1 DUF4198 domain-containing protein [Treponema phagedenis]